MDSKPDSSTLPSRDDLLATLKEAIDAVFSSMFISIREESSGSGRMPSTDPTVDIEVSVDFTGALNGCVVLRCSGQGAEDIARGLLMMEEGDVLELEDVKDALGECGNMVTGHVKSKALDPISNFAMGIPLVRGPGEGLTEPRNEGSLVYKLTRGVMSAELWVDSAAA